MRLDRILAEGEAVLALSQIGFAVREVEARPGLYVVSHPRIGGSRVFTIEQLTSFAEGATVIESHLKAIAQTNAGSQPMAVGGSGGV